jgi:uncharacterized protein (TIGR03083 family)
VTGEAVVPQRILSIDVGAAYRGVRERIVELTMSLSEREWEKPVPHCPDWTVRQTVAHLAGIVDDALNDNMSGVATDAWTAVQVAKRADMAGPEIMAEWTTYAPFVDARATEVGLGLAQLLFDAVNHEHDLRHALGRPGARDSDALWVAAHFVSANITTRCVAAGLEPIRLIVDDEPLTGPYDSEFRATVFEIVRAACSRRSLNQIAALDWRGSVTDEHLRLFSLFVPPSADIIE